MSLTRTTAMVEDQHVSTVLTLCLHPSPVVARPRVDRSLCETLPDHSEPSSALTLFPSTKSRGNFAELIDAGLHLSLTLPLNPKKPETFSPLPVILEEEEVEEENHNHWINKRLTVSDVNSSSRLLLPKQEILKYVLPMMDLKTSAGCQSRDGTKLKIWDLDTNSEHKLTLKRWITGSFVLTTNWNAMFIKRRSLQVGDNIRLSWDFKNQRFLFTAQS